MHNATTITRKGAISLFAFSGKILTVESVPFKVVETETLEKLDTESTLWSESGRHSRMYLFAIRIFYFVGQPAFEKIGK